MKSSIATTMQRTLRAALLAAAAGAAFVPAATAQTVTQHRSVTSTSNADNAARVEVRGDKYTITLNGKEVKSGTLADNWTEFPLVDENGESVGTVTRDGDEFSVILSDSEGSSSASGGGMSFGSAAGARRAAIRAELDAVRAAQGRLAGTYAAAPSAWGGQQPRTMLGVTLENPGEAISAQLGIDRENSTILTSITDGLPASKAGLKLYDIITEVEGQPASPETLRRMLREKKPGETLSIKYFSAATRKDAVITLEAYDSGRLNTTWSTGAGNSWSPAGVGNFTINVFDEQMEQKAREMEALGRQLGLLGEKMAKNQGDAKALEAFAEQMNKIGEEMSKRGEEMARAGANWGTFPGAGQTNSRTIIGRARGSGPNLLFETIPPSAPGAPAMPALPGTVTTLDTAEGAALKERMDKMDERLAKLTELLEKAVQNQAAAKPKDQ